MAGWIGVLFDVQGGNFWGPNPRHIVLDGVSIPYSNGEREWA